MNIYAIALFFIGAIFLYRNVQMFCDADKMKEYVETSPKAAIWRKKFGTEKAMVIMKKFFLPLGIFLMAAFVVFGFLYGILPLLKSF